MILMLATAAWAGVETVITCDQCGKAMKPGDSYYSLEKYEIPYSPGSVICEPSIYVTPYKTPYFCSWKCAAKYLAPEEPAYGVYPDNPYFMVPDPLGSAVPCESDLNITPTWDTVTEADIVETIGSHVGENVHTIALEAPNWQFGEGFKKELRKIIREEMEKEPL